MNSLSLTKKYCGITLSQQLIKKEPTLFHKRFEQFDQSRESFIRLWNLCWAISHFISLQYFVSYFCTILWCSTTETVVQYINLTFSYAMCDRLPNSSLEWFIYPSPTFVNIKHGNVHKYSPHEILTDNKCITDFCAQLSQVNPAPGFLDLM